MGAKDEHVILFQDKPVVLMTFFGDAFKLQ